MTRRAISLFFVLLFAAVSAFARQDEDAAARRAEEQRQAIIAAAAERAAAEAAAKERERSQNSLRDFLNDSREMTEAAAREAERRREMRRQAEFTKLKEAFFRFESNREKLASALGFKAKLKDPAKEIEKSAAVFLAFIKERSDKRQGFEAGEFKNFTASELGWEALTSAERVAPQLAAIIQSETDSVVDINFLMALSKVEAELLRLQWMTKKLK